MFVNGGKKKEWVGISSVHSLMAIFIIPIDATVYLGIVTSVGSDYFQ